jgi:predicted amidophosphoribosyltransferase
MVQTGGGWIRRRHDPQDGLRRWVAPIVSGRPYGPGMVLASLLPARCPVCGAAGPVPCAPCVGRMRPAVPGPLPPGLDACWSLLAYEGAARTLVARLKYRNDRTALVWLADGMAALVEPPPTVVVTWAPTSRRRRRRRGFDQAELLAGAVARRLGAPCRTLLERSTGPPQTGLSLAARRRGPSFVAAPSHWPHRSQPVPASVIVVDDVVTTGSTFTAASWALRSVGVSWVAALTAARTPRMAATPTVPPPLPLSVPGPPPDVESSLKFRAESADIRQ